MKKVRIFVTLLCLACIAGAHAQGGFNVKDVLMNGSREGWSGLRLAYDRPILKSTSDYSDLKQGFNGLTLTYVQAWNVTRSMPLFVEAGAGLGVWRHSFDFSEEEITLKTSQNMLNLYIPVNAIYTLRVNDHISVKPFTGLYLRLGLMGKEKYESGFAGQTDSDSYTLYGDDGCDWKRFQMGWQIGATVDYGCYNFGFGYGIDFNKTAPEARFGVFSLRVGMNF